MGNGFSQPGFDFDTVDDAAFDDGANLTYTVSELAEAINDQIRRGFSEGVWVRGEIDGLRHSGPHTYFSIVGPSENGKAVLNVQLFAPVKRRLTPLLKKHRLDLADGLKVRIHGHLDFWAQGGRLGLKMSGLDPRFTLGELSQQREQVIRRLVTNGIYDANKQRLVARVPIRVGVVTSVGTAAWHDFYDELISSGYSFQLAVCDVRVQGTTAPAAVAAAIATLGQHGNIDAVVVIRGGGARNELAVFDAEAIATMIALCPVPVITGLGHETDRSIADEVAHTALKTPTAVARHLIDAVSEYSSTSEATWEAILHRANHQLERTDENLLGRANRAQRLVHGGLGRAEVRLLERAERVSRGPQLELDRHQRHLDQAAERLGGRSRQHLTRAQLRLDTTVNRLRQRTPQLLHQVSTELEHRAARIELLDPQRLLERGWSITRGADGSIVRSATKVHHGAILTTQLADGTVQSRAERTTTPEEPR